MKYAFWTIGILSILFGFGRFGTPATGETAAIEMGIGAAAIVSGLALRRLRAGARLPEDHCRPLLRGVIKRAKDRFWALEPIFVR